LTYEFVVLAGSAVLFLLIVSYAKQIGRALGAFLLALYAGTIVIAFV